MRNSWLARAAVAAVWLYQGLWCKLLGRMPRHEAAVASVPFLSAAQAHAALMALGATECALAAWVLSGRRARAAALAQTVLLAGINAGGVLWARQTIPDPSGMVLQNFAFLVLAWIAAGKSLAANPWQAGSLRGGEPELLFGQMYEDAAIELEAFPPHSRVFAIASAGCTARALADAGHRVTAVDLNPRQLAYAVSRAGGGPLRPGAVERMLARGRRLLPLLGWSERRRREFLSLDDPEAQALYWKRFFDTRRWRVAVDALLWLPLLRTAYAGPLVAVLPRNFGAVVRERLRRNLASHSNQSNPYACRILLGAERDLDRTPSRPIHFVCADATAYLESCPPASFDAFALSNILDGAPPEYRERLYAAVRHAAAPDAMVVIRSFGEPARVSPANCAARDRSLLWGIVDVGRVGDVCCTC